MYDNQALPSLFVVVVVGGFNYFTPATRMRATPMRSYVMMCGVWIRVCVSVMHVLVCIYIYSQVWSLYLIGRRWPCRRLSASIHSCARDGHVTLAARRAFVLAWFMMLIRNKVNTSCVRWRGVNQRKMIYMTKNTQFANYQVFFVKL